MESDSYGSANACSASKRNTWGLVSLGIGALGVLAGIGASASFALMPYVADMDAFDYAARNLIVGVLQGLLALAGLITGIIGLFRRDTSRLAASAGAALGAAGVIGFTTSLVIQFLSGLLNSVSF